MGSGAVQAVDTGIIPRVMGEMFSRIEDTVEGERPVVKVSFMELYKEELRDLLDANTDKVIKMYDTATGPTIQVSSHSTQFDSNIFSQSHFFILRIAPSAPLITSMRW